MVDVKIDDVELIGDMGGGRSGDDGFSMSIDVLAGETDIVSLLIVHNLNDNDHCLEQNEASIDF